MAGRKENVCSLCGMGLKKTKGMNRDGYEYSLQKRAHITCLRKQKSILQKYHVSGDDYLHAVVNGLFELFPELNETKEIREYNSQLKKMKEEREKEFPYLKEVKEKNKEAAKEDVVEKEEEKPE